MSAAVAFGPTANPDAYVPWSGSERALGALVRWASAPDAPPICLLIGPPGMGKTLLLKLVAARTREELQSLYLAYPDCDPAALCAFVLHGLGGEADGATPEGLLAALRTDARPLLLLVDEGELLPLDTVRCLREIATKAAGRLRIVIALTRDDRGEELASAFGDAGETVRIEGSMSKAEVAAHVRTQLARAAIDPRLGARFDHATLARLHTRSEGVPASLQSLAAALLFEAQRARGEIRYAPREAAPATEDEAEAPAEFALPVAESAAAKAPPIEPRRARRVPTFALGTALGIAAGIGLSVALPRWLASQPPPAPVAEASRVEPTPPPVAAAPPPAVVAPAPAVPAVPQAPIAVSINSEPWASIEVDGRRIGETPIAAHPLPRGRHRVIATLADGRVIERDVEIDGEHERIVFP